MAQTLQEEQKMRSHKKGGKQHVSKMRLQKKRQNINKEKNDSKKKAKKKNENVHLSGARSCAVLPSSSLG